MSQSTAKLDDILTFADEETTDIPLDRNLKIGNFDPFNTPSTGWSVRPWKGGLEYKIDLSHYKSNRFQDVMLKLFMCDSFHDFKPSKIKNIYRLWLGKKFRNIDDYRKMLRGDSWWEKGEKAEVLDQDKLQDNEMFDTIPLNQWFNEYMDKPCGMTAYNLALKSYLKTAGVIPIDIDENKTDIYFVKDVMTKQSTQTLNDVINYVLDKGKINTINTNTIATIMDTGSGARNPKDKFTCKKPMKITLILPGTREITAEYTLEKNDTYQIKINFEYMSK